MGWIQRWTRQRLCLPGPWIKEDEVHRSPAQQTSWKITHGFQRVFSMWKIGRNFSQLRGFGRGSMEVRFHLAEVALRVFQEERTWTKVQRLGRADHILGNSVSGLTITLYTCLGIMPKGCLLAGENGQIICLFVSCNLIVKNIRVNQYLYLFSNLVLVYLT